MTFAFFNGIIGSSVRPRWLRCRKRRNGTSSSAPHQFVLNASSSSSSVFFFLHFVCRFQLKTYFHFTCANSINVALPLFFSFWLEFYLSFWARDKLRTTKMNRIWNGGKKKSELKSIEKRRVCIFSIATIATVCDVDAIIGIRHVLSALKSRAISLLSLLLFTFPPSSLFLGRFFFHLLLSGGIHATLKFSIFFPVPFIIFSAVARVGSLQYFGLASVRFLWYLALRRRAF